MIQDSGDITDFQLDFLVINALEQVLAFNVFHNQVNIAIGHILEVINQLNDILVFDPVQNLYLFLDHQHLACALVFVTHLLYSVGKLCFVVHVF